MYLRRLLLLAAAGWIAGVCIMFLVGYVILPAVTGDRHYPGTGLDVLMLGIVGLIVSVAAIIGGLLGGRLSTEGGRSSQILMAIVLGIILALPVSCITFWYTGW